MADKMLLYWGSGSGPCWRVMITLEEKNLGGYTSKMISFSNKEHKGEEIMKLNPRGQVPTFKDGDIVINESIAACEYLELTYPNQGTRLLPDDKAVRASVLQRVQELANLNKAMIDNIAHYFMRTKEDDRDKAVIEEKFTAARTELSIWEKYLDQIGDGGYLAGKSFTMADVIGFPTIAFCVRMGLNLEKFPRLNAYYNLVKDRPSVQTSWPPHWKDSSNQTHLAGM